MELQSFINNNQNYLEIFRKNNFKINTFKKLKIISYNYNNKPEFDKDNIWKLYLKGVIIDENDKIVCLSPMKSIDVDENNIMNNSNNYNLSYLIDGTMINLFYYNNEWIISTRSEIGGYNKWDKKKSFRKMFDECSNIDYDKLNKNYSYSFVMRHIENRNISPINENLLLLINIYDLTDNNNIHIIKDINILNDELIHLSCNKLTYNNIDNINNLPYYIKGFTYELNNFRYKWINPNFQKIKELKGNNNNINLTYLELRKNGKLKEYLKYFPENNYHFNNYRSKIHQLSNELFHNYRNLFIYKKITINEIEYHLKPHMYNIHKLYLKNKNPITWDTIKNYVNTMENKKLLFTLNYM